MTILSAESSFKRGLAALGQRQPDDAAKFFRSAIELERQRRVSRPDMRYLSYYGLSLAQGGKATRQAIRACETAVARDGYDPDLVLNLAKVYVLAGKTTRALETLERGLRMAQHHPGLKAMLSRLDRRSRPVVSFLDRSHPINRVLGRTFSRGRPSGSEVSA